jgi:hypothetical protein
MEHLKEKDEESVVTILRFQGGSPPSESIKDCIVLVPMASFNLY